MVNFEKAFKPMEWQNSIIGMTEEGYKAHVAKVYDTFLDCGTDAGKVTFDKCIEKVNNESFFAENMINLLKDNVEKVRIVANTDLLVGYVVIEQFNSSIKYYIDHRVVDKLKRGNKMPRKADEVFNFFVKNMGFVPLKFKTVSLSDLSDEVSYRFDFIKKVMDEGDNSDAWSNAMKVQLLAGFSHLEYLPSEVKYYFVLQGKHGWYLRADSEKNEVLKKKHLEKVAKEKEAKEAAQKAAEEAKETVAITETEVEVTAETAEA